VYGFSMLWYLAQILPLPTAHHRRIVGGQRLPVARPPGEAGVG
jgi:hypothetical protein